MAADLFENENTAAAVQGRRYYCPSCRKPLRRVNGRLGPFWGCTAFPECTTSLFDKNGRPSDEPDERFRCPVCTRPLAKAVKKAGQQAENQRTREKGDYWFCTGYNRGCKVTLPDKNGIPAASYRCRVCGHLLKKRHGKNGDFWGCTQYPDCRQTYRDVGGSPDIPRT